MLVQLFPVKQIRLSQAPVVQETSENKISPILDAMENCYAYCLATTFDFEKLTEHLGSRHRLVRYKDAVHLQKAAGDAFLFHYGIIVAWNYTYDDFQTLLAETRPFARFPFPQPIVDEFTFSHGNISFRIHADQIFLTTEDPLEKLAVSHGIAQSVKLSEFEEKAQVTIEETTHIPQGIAEKGYTNLSRKEISKMRGGLYLVKSNIHLHFDLLDTPEFFWEYPERQDIYCATINYLEVSQRMEVLTKKLNVIHELFNMLSDEQKHKHSSTLEWIIIWLIAIEIIIFLVHDILGII